MIRAWSPWWRCYELLDVCETPSSLHIWSDGMKKNVDSTKFCVKSCRPDEFSLNASRFLRLIDCMVVWRAIAENSKHETARKVRTWLPRTSIVFRISKAFPRTEARSIEFLEFQPHAVFRISKLSYPYCGTHLDLDFSELHFRVNSTKKLLFLGTHEWTSCNVLLGPLASLAALFQVSTSLQIPWLSFLLKSSSVHTDVPSTVGAEQRNTIRLPARWNLILGLLQHF